MVIWYNFCIFADKITHFMKAKIFLVLALITVIISSCSLEGDSNYTPQIIFLRNPYLQNGDSLSAYYTDEGGVYRLDTISVGDTVMFQTYMTGVDNNLTAFYLKESADSVTRIVLPDKATMDSIFLPTSDYKTGKFLMTGKSTVLYFPFKYVAKAPSKTARLQITVVSDANFENNFGSNTTTITLITPIVSKSDDTNLN